MSDVSAAWVAGAAVAQAVLLLVAAVIAFAALSANRRGAKRQNSIAYFARYQSAEFAALAQGIYLKYGLAADAGAAEVAANLALYQADTERYMVLRLLNFFEELGTVYWAKQLDNDLALAMLGGHSLQVAARLSWLTDWIREQTEDERTFDKWMLLNEAARAREAKHQAARRRATEGPPLDVMASRA